MKRLILAALISAFAAGSAMAAGACGTGHGKRRQGALSGAAKTSKIQACCESAATAAKLSGAAKTSNVNKCIKDAG